MTGRHSLESELASALRATARDVWKQERKMASTADERAEIDQRWSREFGGIENEAEHLAGVLSGEQVRARIERERHAKLSASFFRIRTMLAQVQEMMGTEPEEPNSSPNG